MKTVNERVVWIDLVRTFAILFVVLCHSVEAIYNFNPHYVMSISKSSRLFFLSSFTIGRMGVPLFLMISGYLLLDKEYTNENCKIFWKDKWLRLFICTDIWFIIYDIFLYFNKNQPIDIMFLIEELLFVRKPTMNHVWYMPMIIGMYILIPFASKAIKSFDVKRLRFPLIFIALYAFVAPFVSDVVSVNKMEPLTITMSLGFSGGCYGVFFIIGYLVKKGVFNKLNTSILLTIGLVAFICTVAYQIWQYSHYIKAPVWYNNPLLLICTSSLFILLSRVEKVYLYKLIYFISYFSFAVYLIHNIFKYIFIDYINKLNCPKSLQVIIIWSIIVLLSFPIAWLIKHIPKVGKFILYLK